MVIKTHLKLNNKILMLLEELYRFCNWSVRSSPLNKLLHSSTHPTNSALLSGNIHHPYLLVTSLRLYYIFKHSFFIVGLIVRFNFLIKFSSKFIQILKFVISSVHSGIPNLDIWTPEPFDYRKNWLWVIKCSFDIWSGNQMLRLFDFWSGNQMVYTKCWPSMWSGSFVRDSNTQS
jgi:hypothetical protein